MVIIDNGKKKTSSKQYKAKIFDRLTDIRSTKSHFYTKPGNFQHRAPVKKLFCILEHNIFIF